MDDDIPLPIDLPAAALKLVLSLQAVNDRIRAVGIASRANRELTHLVVGDDQHTKIWAKGMRNSAATDPRRLTTDPCYKVVWHASGSFTHPRR
jgi:hypothetical protein